jgi:hypothetical protein
MAPKLIDRSTFDKRLLSFKPPKKNQSGGYVTYFSYDNNDLFTRTCQFRNPFPVEREANDGGKIYSLDGSFDDGTEEFKQWVEDFDNAVIDAATENSQLWFGKTRSRDIISELYVRNVRQGKKVEYAPTFKMRVPCWDGRYKATLYDTNKEPIPWSKAKAQSMSVAVVYAKSIWFANKQFGVLFDVDHAMLLREGSDDGFTECNIDAPTEFVSKKRNVEDESGGDSQRQRTDVLVDG